jgi:hypothetical protein
VDEKRTDLRAALQELGAEEPGNTGPHVGLKRLIAYHRGTLPTAEREALQEHLSLCARCTRRLRELRDFEAASSGEDSELESLRQEAWKSLVQQLPADPPAAHPIAGAGPRPAPRSRRLPYLVYGAAAALLLAVLGYSAWTAITVQRERQRSARLEQRLAERDEALAVARRSIVAAEDRLAAARRHIQDLEKGTQQRTGRGDAEAASEPEKLQRTAGASNQIAVSLAPRFGLRGQENAESGFLRGGGAVNPVRIPMRADSFTVAVSLADRPVYREYRLELMDRNGKVLWAGRRPGRALLGDVGTSVSVSGLGSGSFRLRIEGVQGNRSELLAEYRLAVERQTTPK